MYQRPIGRVSRQALSLYPLMDGDQRAADAAAQFCGPAAGAN